MILVIVTALLSVLLPWGQGIDRHPVYHLNVRIEPSLSSIEGNVEIEEPGAASFFLTKSLRVLHIMADGKPVSFQSNPSATEDNSFEIVPNANNPKNLVIKYAGQINPDSLPKTVSSVNMIKSELVELSNYIDWYPRLKQSAAFRFTLEADVPLHYVTVMGGTLRQEKVRNERNLTRWENEGVRYDITLLTAPNLHKAAITQNGMAVEIYYDKLPSSYVETMKSNLMNAVERLVGLYGKPGDNNLVRVVYSPRSGFGYARNPLILVSEKFTLEQLSYKFGPARDLRLNIHEIAHYWDRADASTPEDWINEGLAEYAALLLSEEIVGKEFSDLLLSEYREISDNSDSDASIAETSGNSIYREVNRYYRPAILLNEVRQKYGEEKVRQFFKALYARCLESNSLTTAMFLEEMGKDIGEEARDYFSEALYRKNWKIAEPLPACTYSPSDTIFLGRWTGGLTQFGATARFILNLKVKEGKLIATLDSPDQNVKDIPVTEAKIEGDSIFLRVSVASATYEGRLDRSQMKIEGEWKQRGIDYPLNLTKEKQPE